MPPLPTTDFAILKKSDLLPTLTLIAAILCSFYGSKQVYAQQGSGWQEISTTHAGLAIHQYGGPGFYYNPTDMYIRPGQKIGFTINTYFLEVQVRFDGGSWQTVKLCDGPPCKGYFLVDQPWTSQGVQSMAMRWRGEDGYLVNARTYTVYVVPPAQRIFRDSAGNTMTTWEGGNGTIDNPFVVIEGFDPTNENFPEKYYQLGEDLFSAALGLDQDMIVFNFAEGGIDIATNAQHVIDGMRYLAGIRAGSNAMKLAGVSMGGVVARYALAQAEDNGQALDVSHFASIDSPQVDAVMDAEMLDFLKDETDGEHESIASMAAKQMLRYNPYDLDGSIHAQFYSDLNSLNGGGYPRQSKNIGVSFSPNTQNPNSGLWLELEVFLANWRERSFYINQGDPTKEPGSFLPRQTTMLWGRSYGATYELVRHTDPTFIPHESALDLTYSGGTSFDVAIFSDTPGFHNEVPQDIVGPLLQEMDVGTPVFPPGKPQNFRITSTHSDYYDHPVSMEWDMVSSAEKYHIYRCRIDSPTYSGCNTPMTHILTSYSPFATDVSLYMDDGAWGDGGAKYHVEAINSAGTSVPSDSDVTYVKDMSNSYLEMGDDQADVIPVPDEFGLDPSTPNPARHTVTIRYALPEASDVSLVLYDVMGRAVARLAGDSEPAGFHDVQLDTSDLASGMYLYRFQAGDFTMTRRMTIVR
jgi:hypothetical protein